jgi:hypothetical protein
MMFIGLPAPQVVPKRLTARQKWLAGKKCYHNLLEIFGIQEVPAFRTQSKREQREWIRLALMP